MISSMADKYEQSGEYPAFFFCMYLLDYFLKKKWLDQTMLWESRVRTHSWEPSSGSGPSIGPF